MHIKISIWLSCSWIKIYVLSCCCYNNNDHCWILWLMNKKFKWNQKFEKTLAWLADTMKSVGFLHFSLIKIIWWLAPVSRLAWSVLFVTPSPVSHINSSVQKFNSSRLHQSQTQFKKCLHTYFFLQICVSFATCIRKINEVVVTRFSPILIHSMIHLKVSIGLAY